MPGPVLAKWMAELEQQLGEPILKHSVLGGGDFADAFMVTLASGRRVFVKTHQQALKGFFETEAAGLRWLRDSATVNVPEVIALSDEPPLLALEWVDRGSLRGGTEREFGAQLAALHQCTAAHFGRPDQRNTGSQGLPNTPCNTWAEFYATCRLLPLARIAAERRALPDGAIRQLESVASRLPDLGGDAPRPSLLHGDLWSGNRLLDANGQSWLIDAAAHYSHPEFDLAMMRLFGGFSSDCFAAYNEVSPFSPGIEERVSLHQLAPLVVHAIKFGAHYVHATEQALSCYK